MKRLIAFLLFNLSWGATAATVSYQALNTNQFYGNPTGGVVAIQSGAIFTNILAFGTNSFPGRLNVGTIHATNEIIDVIETNINLVGANLSISNNANVNFLRVSNSITLGNPLTYITDQASSLANGNFYLRPDGGFDAANDGQFTVDGSSGGLGIGANSSINAGGMFSVGGSGNFGAAYTNNDNGYADYQFQVGIAGETLARNLLVTNSVTGDGKYIYLSDGTITTSGNITSKGGFTGNGNSLTNLSGNTLLVTATNRLYFTTVSSLTNTLGREATAIVTAGTSVALQDTNGASIATIGTVATLDVLIPMHVNMRLSGTGLSAILY